MTLPAHLVTLDALISPCGLYRYWLRKSLTGTFDPRPFKPIGFIMLNPSAADHTQNDPTIRRCMAFSDRWGASHLCVVNLFALRSPYPEDLWAERTSDPVGPDNDEAIRRAIDYCDGNGGFMVAAWGNHGSYMDRAETVRGWSRRLRYLHLNERSGHPAHPLYLKAKLEPVVWADNTATKG